MLSLAEMKDAMFIYSEVTMWLNKIMDRIQNYNFMFDKYGFQIISYIQLIVVYL